MNVIFALPFFSFCFILFFGALLFCLVQQPSRKIGSIADYDPLNENYGSLATGFRTGMPPPQPDVSNMYRGGCCTKTFIKLQFGLKFSLSLTTFARVETIF